jgi:prepilin-type N-terminal cleavage/methylation domain-containing protein
MRERGFTLLEVLLSVAILTMITGISLPILASLNNRNDLDVVTQNVAMQLRRAQSYARAVKQDSQWGVRVQAGSATLFKGSSYASRDSGYDEEVTVPAAIVPSGLSEVVFTKLTAAPSASGTITLTLQPNDIRTVTLNAKGMVAY